MTAVLAAGCEQISEPALPKSAPSLLELAQLLDSAAENVVGAVAEASRDSWQQLLASSAPEDAGAFARSATAALIRGASEDCPELQESLVAFFKASASKDVPVSVAALTLGGGLAGLRVQEQAGSLAPTSAGAAARAFWAWLSQGAVEAVTSAGRGGS